MVKNLSNPINARKVARILSQDAQRGGFSVEERDISVFLSDHRISDFQTAMKQLQAEQIVPAEYNLSDSGREELLDADLIDPSYTADQQPTTSVDEDLDLLGDLNTNSIEFKTQLESLKSKLITSWSGGISIDGHELDNFDRKFGRPMKYFQQAMADQGVEVSDLQAFAVVYATDHLSLGDNSKEDVYNLMFGRFDKHKTYLQEELGFDYSWPHTSGTSFIEIGKKFTIAPELAEFAKRFRGISGLDTYSDDIIQVFFFNLISGPLLDEMIAKNLLFRWADDRMEIADPYRWLLPQPEFNMDRHKRDLLIQSVIAHTLLTRINSQDLSLRDVIDEVKSMDSGSRRAYLAKKIEAALTRKSVALQFGTTLANFFENFKKNPVKVAPFLDTTIRYFSKTQNVQTLFSTVEHSIRTGLKNSTGIIKQFLRDIGDEDLVTTIKSNLERSIVYAVEQTLSGTDDLDPLDFQWLDGLLRTQTDEVLRSFFSTVFDQVFQYTNQYAKSLESQKTEPVSSVGGLTELTQDFMSTVKYHGSQNWQTKEMISDMVEGGLQPELAEMICHISSYMTYQIASKEGKNGEQMMISLVNHYEEKARALGKLQLSNGSPLSEDPGLVDFFREDLRQAHVLISLSSKTRTEVYNAWTPLDGGRAKATRFLNDILMPNLLYWQRQPRPFIMDLLQSGKIDKSMVKTVVAKTSRLSLLEAYSLLSMGSRADINSFADARQYLQDLFGSGIDAFTISPRTGEAEIALETIHLWSHLQEVVV